MNCKAKGINAERELIHLFWQRGWAACRTPGSGCMRYPSPDIIAGNNLRKVGIECKSVKADNYYFTKDEIAQLAEFCRLFNAEPWVGVKFGKNGWFFSSPEDLEATEKHFLFDLKLAKRKGLAFDELLGFFNRK